MLEGAFERVEIDRTVEIFFCAVLFEVGDKYTGKFECLAGTACEVDLDSLEVDAFKKGGNGFGRGFFNAESERGDTLGQNVERLCICFGGSLGDDFLTGEPVIVSAGTAHIGKFPGKRVGSSEVFDVFSAIHGLNIESFIGSPDQFLVKRSTFQVCLHFGFPLGC